MTRVLQVITVRMGYEGISMSVMRLVQNMTRERIRVDFATIGEPPAEMRAQLEDMGCRVHVIPGRMRHPLRYMRALSKIVREGGYKIVHAHGNSCTLALEMLAAKRGGAQVRAAHSHNTYCKFTAAHRLLRPAFDRLYTHAWACGTEAGKWLFHNRPFRVAPVAIETEKYAFDPDTRRSCRNELGLEGKFVIGCVANLKPQKNHMFLLDVFALVHAKRPDVQLLLIGEGPLRNDIEVKTALLGLTGSVTLLGLRHDVPALLQACDMMALTSLHEGFPSVLLEWQCAGLRALVSDRVTCDANLTGLIEYLPIDNADSWLERIERAQPDADRADISKNAISIISDAGYDVARSAHELEKFYIEYI